MTPFHPTRRSVLRAIAGGSAAAMLPGLVTPSPADAQDLFKPAAGLRGGYGFLTHNTFGPRPEAEIRDRVKRMAEEFGILEFQFYNWFADYSTPTRGDEWTDAFYRQHPISRRSISVAIDEVFRRGGRSWAYVMSVAAEEKNLANPARDTYKVIDGAGKWYWHPGGDKPRFPTYFLCRGWARLQVKRWAKPVKALGFDGIHWDTVGCRAGDYAAEKRNIGWFLETAKPLLAAEGLVQTFNFVNMAWWDRATVRDQVEFPYVEMWEQKYADKYFEEMESPELRPSRGVMTMYAVADPPEGASVTEILHARAEACRQHRLAYFTVGDGAMRMKREYFPDSLPLTDEEVAVLRVADAATTRP